MEKIYRLQGFETDEKPWVEMELRSKDAALRQAAALCLFDKFDARELQPTFLDMLRNERDDDVAMTLMYALGMWSASTKDSSLLAAIRTTQRRFDGAPGAFQEAAEDALLRIWYGLDSKTLVQLSDERRQQLLTEVPK